MAGGGNKTTGGTSNTNPSWMGGSIPSTFDPKTLGTTIMSDASRTYAQGPKVNPISTYTPFGQATTDTINSSMAANRGFASGANLGNGNPFLNAQLQQTRDNVLKDLGSQFTSSGRFGGGSYIDTATNSLANAENSARFGQYNTDVAQMMQAQGQNLGMSNLLDQKAAEKTAADRAMWDAQNNQGYNHIASYMNLMQGGKDSTNKPVSIWDILSGVGTVAGAFF